VAPSSRAASSRSFDTVDRPARKISRLMPKVDHSWTATRLPSAVDELPSQSTAEMPNTSKSALKLPS
jgi:hypothetical protein